MKTGRDVVIVGRCSGADGSVSRPRRWSSKVCIMMRKCHLNTCPVGVATQDPVRQALYWPARACRQLLLRRREVREIMAQLGIRRFDDLIGRADLLDIVRHLALEGQGLDFSNIFTSRGCQARQPAIQLGQDHGLAEALDHKLIEQARPALENSQKVQIERRSPTSTAPAGHHAFGEGGRRYGHAGLAGRHHPSSG